MTTTKIKARDLNYHTYSMTKYDRDIVNSIPFHALIHKKIHAYIRRHFRATKRYEFVDLGVGTGITSQLVQRLLPQAHIDAVDFSRQMLRGARKKLGTKNVTFIFGDYAKRSFTKKYDCVISVVGLHHQSHLGKKRMFKNIYSLLKPGGIFIFGDLMTHRDKRAAAYNNALHFHHLIEHATDRKTLTDWAHHHMYLNNLAPVEDQIEWLKECGFNIEKKILRYNTTLIIARKKAMGFK